MRFIHSKGIIHRDLKPGNILVTCQGRIRIGDFGSACSGTERAKRTGEPGTTEYSAPEFFDGDLSEYDSKVDIFSFGSILYEILTGKNVFPAELTPNQIGMLIIRHQLPEIPDEIRDEMKRLITHCWQLNPDERPTFNDILQQLDSINFMILPDVEPRQVREYVQGVISWETRQKKCESQRRDRQLQSESRAPVQRS
jgi:serine/threonine protein kinase